MSLVLRNSSMTKPFTCMIVGSIFGVDLAKMLQCHWEKEGSRLDGIYRYNDTKNKKFANS